MPKHGETSAAEIGDLRSLPVSIETPPMEALSVEELPREPGWQFEPKWDGFRCLAFRAGDKVDLRAKSGKPLGRYFPEVLEMLRSVPFSRFVLDGELAIPNGGSIDFDALQMRLHPAESRIHKLSVETPAVLILFDILVDAEGRNLVGEPLSARRGALESLHSTSGDVSRLPLSPYTRDLAVAEDWLRDVGGALDGVVAKRLDGPYVSGERAMLKIKRLRTADCVVGGFRYASKGNDIGSLLLGLYNDQGLLDHVGFTSGFSGLDKQELKERLEALVGGSGFTGSAPGGPSRWSTERSADWQPLRPELVVEVRYDHVTGDRFRHGTRLMRWRPDKRPDQCTFEQIAPTAAPPKPVRDMFAAV